MIDDGLTAYIIFFDEPSHLIHREGLPGLTACMEYPFSPLFGVVRMGSGHKEDAPVCKECFPDG